MNPEWSWAAVPLAGAAGFGVGRRRSAGPAGPGASPWARVLLVTDPEPGDVPGGALLVAWRLVGSGGVLHVLAPVVLPLSVPLEAPPGDETDRATAVLRDVERWVGAKGITVHGHLRRGRTLRTLVRETMDRVQADAAVLHCKPEALPDLVGAVAPALPVVVPY